VNKLIDWSERLLIFWLAALFLSSMLHSFNAHPYVLLLAISECLPVLLVMIRRSGSVTREVYPFLLALIGTAAPLLVRPMQNHADFVPIAVIAGIMTAGVFINVSAKVALWRSFGLAPANRGVRAGGPYRFIRHPMYLGYVVTQAGFLLANPSIANLAIYPLAWTAQLLRIREEEKFLLEDDTYRELAQRVRFRLIPGVY
jgi:protein-S-isoprenylcysteine O-methyltransferase Ste14